MNTIPKPQPSDGFVDPRNRAGFKTQYYPHVNGHEPPGPDATERNDRIKLEFLAAYYDLNCAHASLLAVRQEPDSLARREAEKKLLQNVERLLIVRDGLEDQYAPLGVIAEPAVRDGFTMNLMVSFGNVDAFGRHRSEAYTITAIVPIPLPEGFTLEDVDVKIEGPGMNPR